MQRSIEKAQKIELVHKKKEEEMKYFQEEQHKKIETALQKA